MLNLASIIPDSTQMNWESDIFFKTLLGAIYLRISVMIRTNFILASTDSCKTVRSRLIGVMLGILLDRKVSITPYSIPGIGVKNG